MSSRSTREPPANDGSDMNPHGPGEGDGWHALRGGALTFAGDPFAVAAEEALRHVADALVVIRDGRIAAFGEATALLSTLPSGTPVTRYADALIVPGFVDAHVHYPQLPIIGAFGKTLLDWLDHYTFVAEQQFD